MKKSIYLILLFLATSISAQESETIEIYDREEYAKSSLSTLQSAKDVSEAKKLARNDIKNNRLYLIKPGGIAPTIDASDFEFKQRYDLSFVTFGCEPIDQEKAQAYNEEVFQFLSKQHGKEWMNFLREDVIGLKHYKK